MPCVRRQQPLKQRLQNKWRRFAVARWARRDFRLNSDVPYVSFTFDDFPRSAYTDGGRILLAQGVRGTYFVSLGLLGRSGVSGPIASREDLQTLVREGHELGCHTFEHLDGTRSTPEAFMRSIAANRAALAHSVPGRDLPVFAFPLDGPDLRIKRELGRHFLACRGGGQSFNSGVIDLNLLNAFFLDWRSRGDPEQIGRLIEENAANRGWLIFATHDVVSTPSDYGCSPECLEQIVRHACRSGARVLPMAEVLRELRVTRSTGLSKFGAGD